MSQKRIATTTDEVINDAVRLKKTDFIDLYVNEFKHVELEASRAWHECRVSRKGKALMEQLKVQPLPEDKVAALPAKVRADKPELTSTLKSGDMVTFKQKDGSEVTTVALKVFVGSDDKEYIKYKNGAKTGLKRVKDCVLMLPIEAEQNAA